MERLDSRRYDDAFTLQFTHPYRACISRDLFSMSVRQAGTKGADLFRAWGNAPGFLDGVSRALKVRFIVAATAIKNQLLDESRLQRFFTRLSESWGRNPRLKVT
jgi:hypothetical protein